MVLFNNFAPHSNGILNFSFGYKKLRGVSGLSYSGYPQMNSFNQTSVASNKLYFP
jgi:hypothetical protein